MGKKDEEFKRIIREGSDYSITGCPEGKHYVSAYYKSDGTYVRGHCARRR